MKQEYDFSESVKNPYLKKLKEEVVEYFKSMAKETGIPYQGLIALYLQDCVQSKRKFSAGVGDHSVNQNYRNIIVKISIG